MRYGKYIVCLTAVMAIGILSAMPVLADSADGADKPLSARDIDRRAEAMKRKVRKAASCYVVTGKTYYLSAKGDDKNDGLSPYRSIRTLERLNAMHLKAGDAVLFRRGDLWRGQLQTCPGVSYSAYGKGRKPRLYGSPCNAAKVGEWLPTETPNVYMYSKELAKDVGTLVFNGGEGCAVKVMKYRLDDGTTLHIDTHEPFSGYRDLKRDLEFYHDYKDTHLLYICSTKGNPAKRFSEIELLVKGNCIQARDSVTIDNLCIKYCGAHGIGSGTTKSLVVTNCELGWIGGSIQGEALFGRRHPTRYGNGIEVYGGCQNYRVENCYIYQVYDAGVTHQFSTGGTDSVCMHNVVYSDNLIEDCTYAIEYFLGPATNGAKREMSGITIRGNLLRRAGNGWGRQRPDKETPAIIKSWSNRNCASDFVIRDNIFDRSTHDLLQIEAQQKEWLPRLEGNTYIQDEGGMLGHIGSNHAAYTFDAQAAKHLKDIFGDAKAVTEY